MEVIKNKTSQNKFTTRPGTIDSGKDYEHFYIVYISLKLIKDKKIKNFLLSSNDKEYGSFDDVILEINYAKNNCKKIYALQLKHRDEKCLTLSSLESDSKKFGIKSYFKNFTFQDEITAAILYTNSKFDVGNGKEVNLGPDFGKTTIKKCKTALDPNLPTSENGHCHILSTEEDSSQFSCFCDKFYLYTNQANVNELEIQARELFTQLFGNNDGAFTKFVLFITEWCKITGRKEKLSKEWIQKKIAICVLDPFIKPLSFSKGKTEEKALLLREAVTLFPLTVFSSANYDKIKILWRDYKLQLSEVNTINRKYLIRLGYVKSVEDLEDKEVSIILWLLRRSPLILDQVPEVHRVMKRCQVEGFVVMNCNFSFEDVPVFGKLSDLQCHPEIYKNITEKFTCSLQGKQEVSLKSLFVELEEGVTNMFTTDQLFEMLDRPLLIGQEKETIADCHIPGKLTRHIIKAQYINRLCNENTLVVVSCFPNVSICPWKFDKFHSYSFKIKEEENMYTCQQTCSRKDLEFLCSELPKTNAKKVKYKYHHFRYLDNNSVEWVESNCKVDEIRKILLEKANTIEESDLFTLGADINVICANPGMGKTTLMKSLKNKVSPTCLTALVCVRNYGWYFAKRKMNADDFISKFFNPETQFQKNILKWGKDKRKIVLIWDGLDEITDESLKTVKKIIHDGYRKGYQQWITSRNHLKENLEREFRVLARDVKQFDQEEQKCYIGRRLNCSDEEIFKIYLKIKTNLELYSQNDILGIPLQCFMLTELFRQDKEKYLELLDDAFSLADLYEHFVEEKFKVYYSEKQNCINCNEVMRARNEKDKKQMILNDEQAAIHTYFSTDVVEIHISCWHFLAELSDTKDPTGFIIALSQDNLPEFCHNSFGEYFASLHLSKNSKNFFVENNLLYEAKYNNIRFFYDKRM